MPSSHKVSISIVLEQIKKPKEKCNPKTSRPGSSKMALNMKKLNLKNIVIPDGRTYYASVLEPPKTERSQGGLKIKNKIPKTQRNVSSETMKRFEGVSDKSISSTALKNINMFNSFKKFQDSFYKNVPVVRDISLFVRTILIQFMV
jgi:hypothetical protein